ncbi:MAG: exodeoxyribonuclease III [Candidatus Marinimicrobia bacterium]|nr:exodeoxyribonuclease III [Candidatus Neomarinimicrobiota bacterium]
MKIISWNVNGIRAVIKKGFVDFMDAYDPDIICIQETKAHEEQVELELEKYPYKYWNSAEKKGYSSTAIFSKVKPLAVANDMDIPKHDNEGRVITLEFEDYYLVTVYTPNSKRDLSRLPYRQTEWDVDFLNFVKSLEENKPVIFCGDLNVAHTELDLANPQSNKTTKSRPGNAGYTDEERASFDKILDAGFIDTFREYHEGNGHYSWWSYMGGARSRNVGWRIDYFCISPALKPQMTNAYILPEVMGSDHCPVVLEMN